jgi:uncharacterized protein with HEPN domain
MLDMARKIEQRARDLSRAEFDGDEDVRLVLLHLVQTLGEAANRVSQECRAAHPELPWAQMTGIRHKIVHDYMNISYAILWDVVTRDIPPLLDSLEKINPPEDV